MKLIFDYFSEINKVPRPSKHEEHMIEYLLDFAKRHDLTSRTDNFGNVLISAPASAGMEDRPTVVLQAHMDMVCEKLKDLEFDFFKDAIQTYTDGEWLRAKGTTLGADDGIGIAMAMAVITDKDTAHGPIECLFTRDEETGLSGAFQLEEGFITGKYLINLDSEDEGEIFIGCAGGAGTTATLDYTPIAVPNGYFPIKINIDGLTGGHSGDDINKGRANANKLLARFLYTSMNKYDMYLSNISGGNLHNAIPRDAQAVILVPMADKERIRVDYNVFAAEMEDEFHGAESTMTFKMQSCDIPSECIDRDTASKLINALQAVHNGVLEYSHDIEGLVQTSSNLASIKMMPDHKICIGTSQRSSILSQRICMSNTVGAAFALAGADVCTSEGYPGWKPNKDSKLLHVATETYKNLYGIEPKVKAIHAGLECGLFSEKYPGLDMISIGPTLRGVHSPDERLHIPSVVKVWNHLVAILKGI